MDGIGTQAVGSHIWCQTGKIVQRLYTCLSIQSSQPMKRRELPTQPCIAVAIGFLGPLPSGDYLFVMVDLYSRYKEVKIMGEISAKNHNFHN